MNDWTIYLSLLSFMVNSTCQNPVMKKTAFKAYGFGVSSSCFHPILVKKKKPMEVGADKFWNSRIDQM